LSFISPSLITPHSLTKPRLLSDYNVLSPTYLSGCRGYPRPSDVRFPHRAMSLTKIAPSGLQISYRTQSSPHEASESLREASELSHVIPKPASDPLRCLRPSHSEKVFVLETTAENYGYGTNYGRNYGGIPPPAPSEFQIGNQRWTTVLIVYDAQPHDLHDSVSFGHTLLYISCL
jgi:hypothetical protein